MSTPNNYYNYIGNYNDPSFIYDILQHYILPYRKSKNCFRRIQLLSYEFNKCSFSALPDEIKYLCSESFKHGNYEYLLQNNPEVIIERHHNILHKNGKVKNQFGIHTDNEGPAGGPCHSLLYYYQIDDHIENGQLNFYDDEYSNKVKSIFHPNSGDLISFSDNIYHCPGDFRTDSDKHVVRGVLAIFVLLST